MLMMLVLGTMHFSCRPASYEIIKPKKGRSGEKQGNPNNVVPDEGTPTPGQPAIDSAPPTARIEVIWQDQSVTQVRVNRPVEIRPTVDTVDPDDIGVSSCANPGIVKADYDVAGEAKPTAERKLGCETLGVPYTFTKPGDYKIDMVVTSNENETAFASMTLRVVDENAPLGKDGGFTIQAIPMLVKVGQDVDFSGFCRTEVAHTIDWTYGDASEGIGAATRHAYAAEGQYRVDATCTESVQGGRSWDASLTVVVIDREILIPGQPTQPLPPDGGTDDGGTDDGGTDDGGTDDGGEPGQNPGQDRPGQGIPGQNEPGQT